MNADQVLDEAERHLAARDADAVERTLKRKWSDLSRAPGDAQHILANARLLAGNVREAEDWMRAAAKTEPKSQRHHIALGHMLSNSGKHAEAADAYAAALAINPDWPGLLLVYAGACYQGGRPAQAEQAARQLLQKAPDVEAWTILSAALRAQNKGAEALQAADNALKLDPRHPEARHSRGVALLLTGKAEEALKIFDDLENSGVVSPPLWLHRAAALEALGRDREAEAVYDDAQRRWPHAPNLQARLAQRRRN